MFKDYYAILVISQSATLAEIKSAYRTQARKWHPDKNRGMDTTEKMKEINEAKLILTDEEARVRYDREYLRFKSFQQENEKAKKTEEPKQKQYAHKKQEQEKKTDEKTYESKEEKPKEEYSTYHFDDEILKKWMENARKQAMRNVQEMITEFRDSSIAGFGTFFKTTLMAIVIGIIFFIIIQILKSI
jgi:curved DNA-binding protein CbpA